MKTLNKDRDTSSIRFDALSVLTFPGYTPGGAVANSVIASFMALPCAFKFYAVSVVQLTGANFITAFNVIRDSAADGSPTNPIGTNDNSSTYTLTGNAVTGGGWPPTVAAT